MSFRLVSPNAIMAGGMKSFDYCVSLGDTEEYIFPATNIAGWGMVMVGDNIEWARFRFATSGNVTLEANSTNVSTTNDTNNSLNIYDGGSGIVIENQLGNTYKVALSMSYYTP